MLISLLPQPITLLVGIDNPATHTIPPSGVIARAVFPESAPMWSDFPIGDGHTPMIRVVRPKGEPVVEGLPDAPGSYIVPAQVADALRTYGPELAPGVDVYTPAMLVFPGQPGHPGCAGPVAPGLVCRRSGGKWWPY